MDAPAPDPGRAPGIALALGVGLMILGLRLEGRIWVCAHGAPWVPWHGGAFTPHTSQHLLDPYSFTHFLHGFVFCGLLVLLGRGRMVRAWAVVGAVLLEACWELLENSSWIIERYRAQTAALDYSGDSILNSCGDLLSCGLGAWVAWNLGWRKGLAVFLAIEAALLVWIRDCLMLNVVMLIYPIEALKAWQQGG